MKKIILIWLSFLISFSITNANRDRVSSVSYKWTFNWNITVNFKTKNTSCNIEKDYSWKVLNKFNIAWNNLCRISWEWISCNIIKSSSWIPSNMLTQKVSLSWKYSEILSSIWVSEKFFRNNTETITIENSFELPLSTNSIWKSLPWIKKDFSIVKDLWTLVYSDETECWICKNSSEILKIKEENERILSTITNIEEKEKKKKELNEKILEIKECEKPIYPNSICEKDNNWKCKVIEWTDVKLWINPWILENFFIKPSIENQCEKHWNEYFCYASDKIDFSFKTWKVWDWIDRVILSINNEQNTAPAFENNNIFYENWKLLAENAEYNIPFKDNKLFPSKPWKYTIFLQWDKDKKPSYSTNPLSFKLTIVPNPNNIYWKFLRSAKKFSTKKAYANNFDWYEIFFKTYDKYDNEIVKKSEDLLNINSCIVECFSDKSWISWLISSIIKPLVNEYWIFLKSIVPGKWKPELSYKIPKWNVKWEIIRNSYSNFNVKISDELEFLEPFEFEKISVEWWNINVSKEQNYEVSIKNVWNLRNFYDWKATIEKNLIEATSWFNIKNFSTTDKSFSTTDLSTKFKSTIIAKSDGNIKWKNIWITLKWLPISYKYKDWERIFNIAYTLKGDEIKWCEVNTTWLTIKWNSHSKWKEAYTSELNTFSNISKADLRKSIDKNAKDLTRWLTSWEKTNTVIYFEWNKKYSEIKNKVSDWDSLIIKNWNLLVDEDITKNIWIVVLADKVDLTKIDSNSKWNIYIQKNVSNIKSYLYTDWWFISAKDFSWNKYEEEELRENKLTLIWSLVSSNTVWGWEEWNTTCYLPWNKQTTDCETAERYDLNYIRKHIISCDPDDYSFKMEYNPEIQIKTPKVFLLN